MSGPTESSSAVYKAETLTRDRASHFSSKSCCICELYLMICRDGVRNIQVKNHFVLNLLSGHANRTDCSIWVTKVIGSELE